MAKFMFVFLVFFFFQSSLSDICIHQYNVYPMDKDDVKFMTGLEVHVDNHLLKSHNKNDDHTLTKEEVKDKKEFFIKRGLSFKKPFIPAPVMDLINKKIEAKLSNLDTVSDDYSMYSDEDITRNDVVGHLKVTDWKHKPRSDVDISYRKHFFRDNFDKLKTKMTCPCVCPSYLPKGDLMVENDFIQTQKKMMKKLWKSKQHMPLSVLGRQLKDMILQMADSDLPVYRDHAYVMTLFFHSYFPHADLMMDTCSFTKLVAGSVMYKKTQDVNLLAEALHEMADTLMQSVQLVSHTALYNTKCDIITLTRDMFTPKTCSEENMMPQLKFLVDKMSSKFPVPYTTLLLTMHRSSYYPDRLMAATTIAALTPQLKEMTSLINPYVFTELFKMQVTHEVPACCCAFTRHRLQELMTIMNREVRNSLRVTVGNLYKHY